MISWSDWLRTNLIYGTLVPCVTLQRRWQPWLDVFTILLSQHIFGHGKDRLLTDVCTFWVLLIIHIPSKHLVAQVFLKINQTMSSPCVSLFRTQEVVGILLLHLCVILCVNCRSRTSICINTVGILLPNSCAAACGYFVLECWYTQYKKLLCSHNPA